MEYLNSEDIYYYKYRTDVCRICLKKSDGMTDFLDKNEETSALIGMLSSIGNFEVEFNQQLPNYLCKICQENLRSSFDFQQLVQRSNQLLQRCLQEAESEIESNDSDIRIELVVEEVLEEEDSSLTGKDKVKQQKMRLSQFSAEKVARAIEKSKEKFLTKVTCIKCSFVSSNTRALSVHMSHLHKEIKDYWCSLCNSQVDDLIKHLQQNHADSELKCEFCGKNFLNKGHFVEHLHSHSDVRPFKCESCHKTFISSRHLNNHIKTHTDEKPHKCSHCPKKFIQHASLRNHLKRHKDAQLGEEGYLDELGDQNILIAPQNYCQQCNKKVRSLSVHLTKYHSNPSRNLSPAEKSKVLCTICGKQFRTASKLRVHNRIHTGELPYKCAYCDKRMSSRNQLVVHERVHTGEKPHVCSYCGRAFAQSSVLNTHIRIHTGRTEKCLLCFKSFCRPAQLKLHMRKHTGEKPFLCTECGQSFKQRSHLMEHLKTHSDERPYKCNYCDKGFKQNSSLKSHIQIHLGLQPFKCSQCPYACRQSYSLTQHMKQHSLDSPRPEKPYFCNICQKGFNTMAMLTSHTNLMHVAL